MIFVESWFFPFIPGKNANGRSPGETSPQPVLVTLPSVWNTMPLSRMGMFIGCSLLAVPTLARVVQTTFSTIWTRVMWSNSHFLRQLQAIICQGTNRPVEWLATRYSNLIFTYRYSFLIRRFFEANFVLLPGRYFWWSNFGNTSGQHIALKN